MRETILEAVATRSVMINGLLVPAAALERRLHSHAFNLVVHNDDPTYPVRLVGSATAVLFQDRYMLLCTAHQLADVDPSRVAMMTDDGSSLVTSGRFTSYHARADDDAHDIAAFDFTEPVHAHPELARRFFRLQGLPPPVDQRDILGFLIAGFPSNKQTYDLGHSDRVGLAKLIVSCRADGLSADPALLRLRAAPPIDFDPDGMSGGSAFVLQSTPSGFCGFFSGIVLRGGREFFYVLDPAFVMKFIEGVLALEQGRQGG